MNDVGTSRRAWVAAAVDHLREANSWTGRIHVHKLLFTIKALRLGNPPFDYELYQYGPYSRDLDETFSEMEMYGMLIREYPSPGYGPKYNTTNLFDIEFPDFGVNETIKTVADEFGDRNSTELELIATCLWAKNIEKITKEDEICARVNEIKPKYSPDDIREQLTKLYKMESNLLSA